MSDYRRLTLHQRYQIKALLDNKTIQKEIARIITVHPATISREIRNYAITPDSYNPELAHQLALLSRKRSANTLNPDIFPLVDEKIRLFWSPEQISNWLKKEQSKHISHQTIYQYIACDKQNGGNLFTYLRHHKKPYKKRNSGPEKRGKIRDTVSIEERPAIVEERSRIGDWEMDTIIGEPGGAVLVTMVERKSRYTLIEKSSCKSSQEVLLAMLRALGKHKEKVLTATFDNGKEFAHHKELSSLLDMQSYFAHPYHSWERGLNENTNGLIRQFFAKGTSFNDQAAEDIRKVQDLLNSRPRKSLDYKTPEEIFFAPNPIALAA